MNKLIAISSLVLLFVAVFGLIEVQSEGVEVSAHYPNRVASLYLRGNGCGLSWDKGVQMAVEVVDNGHYKYTADVRCVGETALEVKVLVNDQTWMIGANHHVNTVASNATEIYPWFYTYKGALSMVNNVYSSELHNTRDVIVYTPPSYLENTLKIHKNVLIMHDGQNLFNPLTSAFGTAWMCQDTMNSLIVEGASDEVIIVGAYNTPDRINEYTYIYDPSEEAGGKGDLYLDWIESTLLDVIKKNYRVELRKESLGILGSSLGGLISCYAGWTRSSVYGKVGCMSSSFWWDDNDFQKNVITTKNPTVPYPAIYMDSGMGSRGERECTEYTTQIKNYAIAQGYVDGQNVFQYVDEDGTHDEASWGSRFNEPIQDLYPPITV